MNAQLRQLRDGTRAHIAEFSTIITPMRYPLAADGFGGMAPDTSATPVAQPKARVRLQHESGSVPTNSVKPSGLDTNLSLYVLTDYSAPLIEGDFFEALGFTWTVGPVNPFPATGSLYKTEAPLVKGSAVSVTIPLDFLATEKSSTTIDLTWTDTGAVNTYWIDRKAGTGAYINIVTPGAGVLVFHDTGLTPETTYTYRIRAYNGTTYSAYSAETSATTEATP